jgi:hypothetical protein
MVAAGSAVALAAAHVGGSVGVGVLGAIIAATVLLEVAP